MNAIRLVVLVLVTYALGLGTGVVGGVFLSYQRLSRPVAVVTPPPALPTASPTTVAVVTPSPAPASSTLKVVTHSATPAMVPVSASPSTPETASESPACPACPSCPPSSSSASTCLNPPSTEPSGSPSSESASPRETPSSQPAKPELATLDILANKGEGYVTFVDGTNAGETPATVQLAPDQTHTIKVVGGDRFKSWTGTIKLHPGEKHVLTAILKDKATPTPPPPPQHTSGGGYVPPPRSSGPPSLDNQTRRF